MIYINAENQVLGRLASSVAKLVLSGESVSVFNAEKAAIIGRPDAVADDYRAKRKRGDPYHGPFFPGTPDRILKRTVRGMLPYKTARGKEAFKRLRVFISIPSGMEGVEFTTLGGTENKGERKSITLGRVVERL